MVLFALPLGDAADPRPGAVSVHQAISVGSSYQAIIAGDKVESGAKSTGPKVSAGPTPGE